MRKALWLLICATLVAILLTNSAKAGAISVTCTPELIPSRGGTTTITVVSDKGGIGAIKVIQPNGDFSIVGICFPAEGGSVSKDYPEDFEFPSHECAHMECFEENITISPPEESQRTKENFALLTQALLEQQKSMHAGSTQQLGEYKVRVSLLGCTWQRQFWVKPFFVIPESLLGPLMATTASLMALVLFVTLKLLRAKRRLC